MKENMMPSPEQLKKIQDENMSVEQITQSDDRDHEAWDVLYEQRTWSKAKFLQLRKFAYEEEHAIAQEIDRIENNHTIDKAELEKTKKMGYALAEFKKALNSILGSNE